MVLQKAARSSTSSSASSRRSNSASLAPSDRSDDITDNWVNVAIRCRPLSEKEINDGHKSIIEVEDNKKIIVHNANESPSDQLGTRSGERQNHDQVYEFDNVFGCDSTQELVYNKACKPIVESVLHGYNGTIFAYGQTGTGKTYTMEGSERLKSKRKKSINDKMEVLTNENLTHRISGIESKDNSSEERDSPGIIPRAFKQIFDHVNSNRSVQFLIRASYLEIYQEKLHDLLQKNQTKDLELHERSDVGVYVKDLTSFVCKSIEEIERVMRVGNQNRRVGATDMNERSSRSHAIFMITVEQQQLIDDLLHNNERQAMPRAIRVGKLNLVDLAGSERQRKTNSSGQRQKESIKINLSLSALGNVINSLMKLNSERHEDKSKGLHKTSFGEFIPYRDSKLTRLLQDSLGGNAKTLMIANIGPASYNYDETINTLNYACRAKRIRNRPRLNEDPKDALLRELQKEIDNLKAKLSAISNGHSGHKSARETKSKLSRGVTETSANSDTDYSRRQEAQELKELLDLRQKLSSLESKLLNGNNLKSPLNQMNGIKMTDTTDGLEQIKIDPQELLEGYTREQETQLKLRREELAKQANRELDIRNELEKGQEAEILAQESFKTTQHELDSKRQLMKQILIKIKATRDQTEQIQETYRLELEELDQLLSVLQKELKLKCLVMDNFIPNVHVDQILPRLAYDERRNTCSLVHKDIPLDFCVMATESDHSPADIDMDADRLRPRSEFERIAETIYAGDIRYKVRDLIEPKLEPPINGLYKEDAKKDIKREPDEQKIKSKPTEILDSRIQTLIEAALNQREDDIVI